MKTLLITVLAASIGVSLGFAMSYLMGSFYSVTFEIVKWSGETRFTVILFGFIMACFLAVGLAGSVYEHLTKKP